MTDNISTYLANDSHKPLAPKPSLQQYDNYQIHDLYCEDIIYQPFSPGGFVPESRQNKKFLAVERVSPHESVECNFEAIATTYP